MEKLQEKLKLISLIFKDPLIERTEDEDLPALQHGKYFGGIYKGKKYMYSEDMINLMSIEKLEVFIKKQIGYNI